MSFCLLNSLVKHFFLLLTVVVLPAVLAGPAFAVAGDDLVLAAESPVSADPVYAQQTSAISFSYAVWQGSVNINGVGKNRIFLKES